MTDRQHLSYSYQTQSDTDSDDDNMSDDSVNHGWGEDDAIRFLTAQAAAAAINEQVVREFEDPEALTLPIVQCWKTHDVLCELNMRPGFKAKAWPLGIYFNGLYSVGEIVAHLHENMQGKFNT